ncbi:MAG: sigma-70 family RNA polymerase sigma factor [Alphaproteobacteria bacterium]
MAADPSSGAGTDPSWSDLLAAVAGKRDRDAFSRLFLHFGPRVKSYLRRQGMGNAEAEELMQEVMLTVWRRADQFDSAKASASTWIFTIARNRRVDALRRERVPQIDPNDPLLVPQSGPSADERIDAAERARRLAAAMTELPADQADLLRRSYFEDKSHSAIAAELRLPLGTVKSRLRLAVRRLRALIGG